MGNLFDSVYSQTQSSAEEGIRALEHEMDMNEKLRYPLTKTLLVGGKNRVACTHILRSILTILGTSVRAERVFSSAGNFVNKKTLRTRCRKS